MLDQAHSLLSKNKFIPQLALKVALIIAFFICGLCSASAQFDQHAFGLGQAFVQFEKTTEENGSRQTNKAEYLIGSYTFRSTYGLGENFGISLSPEFGFGLKYTIRDEFNVELAGMMANLPAVIEWYVGGRTKPAFVLGVGYSAGYFSDFSSQTIMLGPLTETGFQFYLLNNLSTVTFRYIHDISENDFIGFNSDETVLDYQGRLVTVNLYYHLGKGSSRSRNND
ncbi:MAG: hypothetical protein HRT74_01910 [Flavobacteriales bacterium]|nr:hypothetical protein [Flavobacteriales bacterium]